MIRMNRSFGPFCRVLLLLLAAALFPAGAEAHAAASSAGRAEDTAAQEIAEEEPDVKRIVLGQRDIVEKTQRLIDAANENGGKDNITVVLIEPFSDETR